MSATAAISSDRSSTNNVHAISSAPSSPSSGGDETPKHVRAIADMTLSRLVRLTDCGQVPRFASRKELANWIIRKIPIQKYANVPRDKNLLEEVHKTLSFMMKGQWSERELQFRHGRGHKKTAPVVAKNGLDRLRELAMDRHPSSTGVVRVVKRDMEGVA